MADEPTTTRDLKRWLLVTAGGIVLVGAGLAWDAAQHASDPDLAAREGPLALTNPSHALAALGLLAVAGGLLGSAWTVWRPSLTSVRAKAGAAATGAVVVSFAIVGGAWAMSGGHDHEHAAAAAVVAPDDDGDGHEHAAAEGDEGQTAADDGAAVARPSHDHPALAPYAERYADASDDERAAADALLATTRSSLVPYADVDDAVAGGYLPPASPMGPMHHYRNPGFVRDGAALDPQRPEGLVYYSVEGREPVLVGAFFVAPRETPAPAPAGELVVWHSHNPSCAAFFATDDEPCTDTLRMLHVWTVDGVDLVRPRTGQTVGVTISDPFGAPFHASIAMVG